jgi:integrase
MKAKKVVLKTETKWEVLFYINGRGSKRVRKRFDKKSDADIFIKNYFGDKAGTLTKIENKDSSRTLYSESEYWLSVRGGEISDGHYNRVKGILDKINKGYGKHPISMFNHSLLTKIRNDLLQKDLSKATANRWLSAITSVIKYSYVHQRISANPSSEFKLLNEQRDEMSFWEKQEAKEFLEYSKSKYEGKCRWKHISYLIALNTGVRAGELWGLKPKDFNFKRKFIHICRQFNSHSHKITETKGKDNRKVPFNSDLQLEIERYIRINNLSENDLLFQNKAKKAISHTNFRKRQFEKDVLESGVSKIRFHDMRHTALTLMVDSGINLKIVQSIAGHKDITTTMKYVHLLGSSMDSVSDQFSI